jgi:eukaryotic-like serine/threonine-protein kinase
MPLSLATFPGTERFRLLRMIGQGGMGVVYEAQDELEGGIVALKVLPLVSPERLLRFKREFRAASEIHHEHLVRLGELVREGDHWFFTMELVDGVDVLTYVRGPSDEPQASASTLQDSTLLPSSTVPSTPLRPRGPISGVRKWSEHYDEGRLRSTARALAEALAALHRAGCVHRDVKPSNVLVTPAGRTVLLDFGLASASGDDTSMLSAGTPLYMAPEQATRAPATSASDWYGFGVVMFELLTGCLPFNGHVYEVIAAKQTASAPPVRSLEPNAPEDLAALVDALLARDPTQRPDDDTVLRRLGAAVPGAGLRGDGTLEHGAPLCVGREAEWAELDRLFHELTLRGEPLAVVLRGESGVGKSTLARSFAAARIAADDAYVFSGRCHERELVPFNAADGLFDAVAHVLRHLGEERVYELLPDHAGVLAQVFPVLARVPAIARAELPSPSLDPREGRSFLFAAARSLFEALGRERPVLLYVDDLQWADGDSLALLSELMRPARGPRVLLVCTLRTHGASAHGDDERRLGPLVDERSLSLANLSAEAARNLALQLLDGVAAGPEAGARIAAESAGHPLFLRELVEEASAAKSRSYEPSLDAVLRRRVARLLPSPRRVLEVLSVASTPVTLSVLRAASGLPHEALAVAVHALRSARLVNLATERPREGLEICHDRVRRSVRDQLSAGEVVALHLALAQALEASGESALSAWHWREAGDGERAARHYRSAGGYAMEALAFTEAVSHFRAALELGRFEVPEAGALSASLADALVGVGRGAEAAQHYRFAAGQASPARAIELKRRAAEELVRSGYLDEGQRVAREVLSDADLSITRSPFSSLLWERTRLKLGRLGRGRAPSVEPEARAHLLARIDLCWSFFCGLVLTDHVQGACFQAKALSLALASGDEPRIARSLAAEASYVSSRGPSHRARSEALFARAEAMVSSDVSMGDDPRAQGTLRLMRGIAAHMNGEFGRAYEALGEAGTIFRERCSGVAWEMDASRQFRIEAMFYLGRLAELRREVARSLREAEDRGSQWSSTNLRTGLPNAVWLMDDDVAAARCHEAQAIERWSARGFHVQHWYALISAVNTDLYEGRGLEAHARLADKRRALARSHLLRVCHIRTAYRNLTARAALAAALQLPEGKERRARLEEAQHAEHALLGEHTPWATALAELAALSRRRLAGEPIPEAMAASVERSLVRADVPVFAQALACALRGDGSALAAEDVRQPARFARMLVPA